MLEHPLFCDNQQDTSCPMQWQKCEPKAGRSLFIFNLCIGGSLYGSLVGADGSVSVPAGSEIRRDPPYFCPWSYVV